MSDNLDDVPVIYVARSLRSGYVAVSADEREIRYLLDIAPGMGESPIRRVDVPALLRVARAAQQARRLSARLDELAAALEADINDVETQTAYELLGSDEIMALADLDAALAALEGKP
jgi:hypothetical protein